MTIALVRNDTVIPVGQLWDEIRDTTIDGRTALQRVYRSTNAAFGPHLETTAVSTPDLRLLRRRTRAQVLADSVVANGDSVLGWRTDAYGLQRPVRREVPPGAIDGSFMDVFVRGAPLQRGLVIRSPMFVASVDSIGTGSAEVVGDTTITQRSGVTAASWVVRMDFMGLASTMWIDKQTRALVRQTITLTPTVHMLMLR